MTVRLFFAISLMLLLSGVLVMLLDADKKLAQKKARMTERVK